MRSFTTLAVAAAVSVVAGAAHAASPAFTTIDNPGDPTFNQLLGITNSGVISGYFGSGMAGHPNQGYTITPPYTRFAPANLPDSAQTQATGLNAAGTVTGFWSPTNYGPGMDANYGFIRLKDGKTFVYLDVNDPLAASGSPVTNQVLGINSSNIAVGFYVDGYGNSHGFAYDVATGGYKPVVVPGAVSDAATGINSAGLISGFYMTKQGTTFGFTMGAGALPVSFHVKGASTTQLLGVNSAGVAVGFYEDANMVDHGIVYNPANGKWTQVDDPNAPFAAGGGTVLNGVNDKGEVVGFYTDAAGNVNGMLVTGIVAP
jgi:hypothetical protein